MKTSGGNHQLTTLWAVLLVVMCLVLLPGTSEGQVDTLWIENFEGNWVADWHVDAGVWQVGQPTSGPGSAYDSLNCAATVLAGNYPEPADTRLIRHTTFVVPPASENPRLRFWHWYSFADGDNGRVQVKTATGTWQTISPTYTWTGSYAWTYASVDLSAYADSTVQIAFNFHSHQVGYNPNVSSGWYLDNVAVISGPLTFNNPEGFESGIGDWYARRGTWEVGVHSSHGGVQCAGTRLDGNYAEPVDSRLVSPPFVVPSAGQYPRLRFWHWYSFAAGDYGNVQIKTKNGSWEAISPDYTWTGSGVWSCPSVFLSAYADSTVQIAFYFHSEQIGYNPNIAPGWFVDDVEVVTGPFVFNNPEGFDSGIGDWSARRGTWETGEPTSGPSSAYNGVNCAGTSLGGNYAEPVDSRLVSPPFVVPSAYEFPRLRFFHWYSFAAGDYGAVQVKTATGPWTTVSATYNWTGSAAWTSPAIDLSAYADSTVQIGFYFHSEQIGYNPNVSYGWFVDDVRIITGPILFNDFEDFESGVLSWSARRGTWQVGVPTSGPGSAYDGDNCAGTRMDGNYHEPVDSRFVTPPFVVKDPATNPALQFWHWFSFSDGDYGEVQISVDGGDWELLSGQFTYNSGGWTPFWADLTAYGNMTAVIAFDFHSEQIGYNPNVSSGWYVDAVQIDGTRIPYIPTLLQHFAAKSKGNSIEIEWRLAQVGEGMEFFILRENVSDGRVVELGQEALSSQGLSYTYRDEGCESGKTYRYQVDVSDDDGRRMLFRTEAIVAPAVVSALHQNFPNPFNPSTLVRYDVGRAGHVSLRVYDATGALVKILYDGRRNAGRFDAAWDGRNQQGSRVSTGVYFYCLRCEGFSATRKMVLLK